MSVSLELLTEILAKAGISSSQEEEILTAIKDATTPPEAKEKLTSEEFYTADNEQACKQEIEEDEEGISGEFDQNEEVDHAYESCIEHWFQAGTRLDPFNFSFYFVNLQFQHLISHVYIYFRLSFAKFTVNIFLLLLRLWLHWKFDYT
jgi:hypothetical protein